MTEEKSKNVSIVIPTHNTRNLLLSNLPHLVKAFENPKNQILEIIVVDDASVDDSVKVIKDNFPQISVIKHKINRGFSASVNTGVRAAKGKYVVLLNSDVYPEENFLVKIFSILKEDKVFSICFHTKGYGWVRGDFKDGYIVYEKGKESDQFHETFFANAGGAIYKRSLWNKIGGMDEKLYSPFYWEDVDISYRAWKRGYKILWSPYAFVSENRSATISKLNKRKVRLVQERNQLLFIWKNINSRRMINKHYIGLFKRLIKHPGYILVLLKAFNKIKWVIRARKKEKKESKVSDESIFAKFY